MSRFVKPHDTQCEIDNAKKMLEKSAARRDNAKAASNTVRKASMDALTAALLESIRPVVSILDGAEIEGLDTGHDRPSARDMGLQIYLGNIIQSINNQLYGYTNPNTGKQTQGQLAWLNEAEHRVNSPQFLLRAECDNLTPQDMKAFHYFELAEARVSMLTDHLRTFKTAYKEITGQDWKPYDPTTASKSKATAPEIANKLKERFGKSAGA